MIASAARAAGIGRRQHYQWLKTSPGYKAAFEQAHIEVGSMFEDRAKDQAFNGIPEPVTYQGQFTYPQVWSDERERYIDQPGAPPLSILKYPVGMQMFLLRGFFPEKYGQRSQVEVTGKDGGPIALTDKNLSQLTDEQLADLIRLTRLLAESGKPRSGEETPEPE